MTTHKPREQAITDVEPGTLFYFVPNPNGSSGFLASKMGFSVTESADPSVPWLLLGRERVTKLSGGYWRYLLLGPGPSLVWHEGSLGWISRVGP